MAQNVEARRRKSAPAARPVKTRDRRAPGFWDRLSNPAQHAVCIAVLIILSFGFFAPFHFGGKDVGASDVVSWRAMAEQVIEYREQTGDEALWAPNAFAGMPAYMISYAVLVPQIDRLPSLLKNIIWPSSHFIVLLLGMYLLVHMLTDSKWSGVLAAAGYGLTTYIPVVLVAGHLTKFIALCYAPWLVLAFAYALRRPRLLSALLFAAALAVNLRAGHPQITYYFLFVLLVWWIVEAVGAVRGGRLRPFGIATGWLALGTVLAALMIAQPYLANYEYKAYTIRGAAPGVEGQEGLGWEYAMAWSQGIGELLTLAIAGAFGGGGGTYWGPKTFTAGPHYVGGIVLMLAILALVRLRRNAVWALAAAAFLMTLFALGEHLPLLNRLMFEYFPLFDAFRVPETWLSAVSFTLAGLAGLGLYYAGRAEPTPAEERVKTKSIYTVLGVSVGVVLLLLLFQSVLFDFQRPDEAAQIAQQVARSNNVSPSDPRVAQTVQQVMAQLREERADAFGGDALRTLIFLALAGVAIWLSRRGVVPAWGMQAFIALLVIIDLWGVGRRYLNEESLSDVQDPAQLVQAYDFDRFIQEREAQAGGPGHFRVLSLEGSPSVAARPSYFHESLGGYHGAKLRLYNDFLQHILIDEQTGLPNETALDLLNTRYVASPVQIPGMPVVYQDQQTGFFVLENTDALPRATFVGRTEVIASAEETWQRLRSSSFDPSSTALLPEPIGFETTPIDSGSIAEARLERYSPREIVWRVNTDAPRLLVVSEIFYPAGWEAEIDGVEVPIHRADYLLRAVPVPAGEHTLVMRFEPRGHTLGLWIAGLSTALVYAGIVLLLGLSWVRRRRPAETDGEVSSSSQTRS